MTFEDTNPLRQGFEEALDDLHRSAQIIDTLTERLAEWLDGYDIRHGVRNAFPDERGLVKDGKAFVEHIRREWNR